MRRLLGAGLVLMWLASLPVLTWSRAHDWQDERVLWRTAAMGSPSKPRPRINLGALAHRAGDLREAEAHYRIALEMLANADRPDWARACMMLRANIARLSEAHGHWEDAIRWHAWDCSPPS